MLKIIALSFALVCGTAVADDTVMICNKEGYTSDAAEFHEIRVDSKRTVFNITPSEVVLDGVKYVTASPEQVGLEGLAVTYYTDNFNKVLYLYVNENGDREIGISAIEPDSDTVFRDKTVFKDCGFEGAVVNGPTAQVLRTNSRAIAHTGAIYVF